MIQNIDAILQSIWLRTDLLALVAIGLIFLRAWRTKPFG